MPDLQQAIQSLYEVFARHLKPAAIVSCPCGCTKPEETAPLLAAPLRELPSADLINYAFSAISTQGSVDDFRYFLPRLLQGVSEDLTGVDPEIVLGKLRYAKWITWPEDEIQSINAYLQALWTTALASFPIEERLPTFFDVESVLACIAITGESLKPYLQTWTDCRTLQSNEILIQFVTMNGSEFSDGRTLCQAFWERSTQQGDELRRWLLRPDTMQRIADSAHLLRKDGWEHLFEPAWTVLKEESAGSRSHHS